MGLPRQNVSISLQGGVDLKTDRKQVIAGKLLALRNGYFKTLKEIRKRAGYVSLPKSTETGIPANITTGNALTSAFRRLCLLDGNDLFTFSESTRKWTQNGTAAKILSLSTQQIIRNTYDQSTCDLAVHSAGIQVYTWEDSSGGAKYQVVDSETGNAISTATISATAQRPKPMVVGNYVVILFYEPSNSHLRYIAIPAATPLSPGSATDFATNPDTTNTNFDAVTSLNRIYVAYNNNATGISLRYLDAALSLSATLTIGGEVASGCINIAADSSTHNLWVSYFNGTAVKYLIRDSALSGSAVLAPTSIETISGVRNITNCIVNSAGSVFYEISASLSYNNYIKTASLAQNGSVTGVSAYIYSLGLAGKAFTDATNNIVVPATYESELQSTYFLISETKAVAKWAAGIGGGLTERSILPETIYSAGIVQMAYLQTDVLFTSTSVTTDGTGSSVVNTNTSQGVGSVAFDFTVTNPNLVDMGQNLLIGSALTLMYDGVNVVEHGFNLYPENVAATSIALNGGLSQGEYGYQVVYEWMDNQGQTHRSSPSPVESTLTPAQFEVQGSYTNGSTTVTISPNVGNLAPGQILTPISAGYLAAGTTIVAILSSTTVQVSAAATGTSPPGVITYVTPQILPVLHPTLNTPNATVSQVNGLYVSGTFTSGSNQWIVNNATGLKVGMTISTVYGYVPANTTITAISGRTVTMSNNATASGTNVNSFVQLLFSGTTTNGSASITGISSAITALLSVGDTITGSGIPASSTVLTVSSTSITISHNATASATVTLTAYQDGTYQLFVGQSLSYTISLGTFTYEITSISANAVTISPQWQFLSADIQFTVTEVYCSVVTVPPLRVTAKTDVNIVFYRTLVNGSVYFRLNLPTSPVANSLSADSVTYVDTQTDAAIVANEQLYTTGGEVDNIAPPAALSITTFMNRVILFPRENRSQFWYSKQVIEGTPVEFSDLFTVDAGSIGGDLEGGIQMDSNFILFKPGQTYYMTGQGPTPAGTANDFSQPILIPSGVGCSNYKSIILIPDGVMFHSEEGFYLLNRNLSTQYVGADVEAYNDDVVSSAQVIDNTTQVRFTMESGVCLMYDYLVGQWSIFENIDAVSSTNHNGTFTYLKSNGTVLKEDPEVFTDDGAFIPLGLTTSWLAFAQLQGFQRVYRLFILGEYFSAHSLVVSFAYNFDDTIVQTVTIPVSSEVVPYQFRVFLDQQKCDAVQITLTDSQESSFGEGLSLSNLSFEVGMKKGLNKLPASQSYGSPQ